MPIELQVVFLPAWFPMAVLILVIVIVLLSMSLKVVREYERAVVFRLGRLLGVKGPGLFVIIPFFDKLVRVDLRIVAVDVPIQKVITRDNVSVEVDAVVYYKVLDPVKAVVTVENYSYAVLMMSMTTLRDVIGQAELDELLAKRDEINKRLQRILDEVTDPWGIKVTAVTVKDVRLPEAMLRAMAKQAEAERFRRARVIEAEGEREAAKIMVEAARFYEEHPVAVRLRELQTLIEVAREKNLVVVTSETSAASYLGPTLALIKAKAPTETSVSK